MSQLHLQGLLWWQKWQPCNTSHCLTSPSGSQTRTIFLSNQPVSKLWLESFGVHKGTAEVFGRKAEVIRTWLEWSAQSSLAVGIHARWTSSCLWVKNSWMNTTYSDLVESDWINLRGTIASLQQAFKQDWMYQRQFLYHDSYSQWDHLYIMETPLFLCDSSYKAMLNYPWNINLEKDHARRSYCYLTVVDRFFFGKQCCKKCPSSTKWMSSSFQMVKCLMILCLGNVEGLL